MCLQNLKYEENYFRGKGMKVKIVKMELRKSIHSVCVYAHGHDLLEPSTDIRHLLSLF